MNTMTTIKLTQKEGERMSDELGWTTDAETGMWCILHRHGHPGQSYLGDYMTGACPWCEATQLPHDACVAFTETGEVR